MNYELKTGNCLGVLPTLEAGIAQTCVTSPPYYQLRDYNHEGQVGHEDTPAAYVSNLVGVFREVRRVLRDDGTCWLNIGDSYCSDNKWGGLSGNKNAHSVAGGYSRARRRTGVKPKNLFLIPFRVALALQDDGWLVRSSIIWNKPNATPEPVTDRPAVAHEYIFLLAKSARYYYDAKAVKEPVAKRGRSSGNKARKVAQAGERDRLNTHLGSSIPWQDTTGKRHRRTVWNVPTRRYPEAHFATFPEQLIEPCILASSREGDLVLDPFNGAGTTGVVALKYGRKYLGCELNPEYVEMSERRLSVAAAMALRAKGIPADIPRFNTKQIETPLFGGVL